MSMKIAAPAFAAGLLVVSAVLPAAAAAPAPTPVPAPATAAPAKPAAKAPAKPAAPAKAAPGDLAGTWSGALVQVGHEKGTAFVATLKGKTGETSYPDQNCTGKLTRAGTAGDYSFFTETIVTGKFDAASGKGCVDGSLTLVRSDGGALVAGWIGTYSGKAIVAYGTLSPKP
jgi:hypothetical protein